jgi:mono/diheme cytochrome c family protein
MRGVTARVASIACSALLAASMFVMACGGGQAGRPDQVPGVSSAPAPQTAVDPVKRGEYLVTAGHCNDCHTPWHMGPKGIEPDMSQMLAGHPAAQVMPEPPNARPDEPWNWGGASTNTAFWGPWGVSYAINLTPDEETGIGLWNEQVFVNAMKTGRHMGVGRPIMPPMPWPNLAQMTDDDLKAMYAYLRSIPPKRNKAPDPVIVEPPAPPAATP